jgi:glucokinase
MFLAGDVGGTKTLLGAFEPAVGRPRAIAVRAFATLEFPDLVAMISAFTAADGIGTASLRAACFGVAGPVVGGTAELTNVPWRVDAGGVAAALGLPRVALINDVQAMAYAVPRLRGAELHPLQAGTAVGGGNLALIAAGTGLGEALIHSVDGRLVPSPGEGGHADFAARTEREIVLLRDLTHRFGRASVEHVVSGRGLVNIHRVAHDRPCLALTGDERDPAAAISQAAMERTCPGCVTALEMFVDAYGAEAGNLALRSVSTGGLFIGGGIAPKILPALVDGRFTRAFSDKPPHHDLLSQMPVNVILNAEAGLLGAAIVAAGG